MQPERQKTRARRVVPALVFFAVLPVFGRLVHFEDFQRHMDFARQMLRGDSFQPHPLFHALLILLCRGDFQSPPAGVAIVLMAGCVAIRAWLTTCVLSGRDWLMATIAVCLAFAMPLPNWWGGQLVLGQPSPNIWHNPTFIVAAPLCIALFFSAVRLLDKPSLRWALLSGILMALSLLAKPNFVIAFLPIYVPTLTFALRRWSQSGIRLWNSLALGFVALSPGLLVATVQAVVLTEQYVVYLYPLAVWKNWSRNIPASIVLGTAFPLSVAVAYLRQVNTDRTLTLAWLTMAVACAMFALMAGADLLAGNWGWGMHLANAVLFVASAAFLSRQPPNWRRRLCLCILVCHTLSGLAYLAYWMRTL
jgi:hypothetical protein